MCVARQLVWTSGKLIELQDVGDDIRILLPGKRTGMIERHRRSNPVEKIANGQAVPVGHESASGQRRRHVGAFEIAAMTHHALVKKYGLTALRLILRIDAVPNRLLRLLRVCGKGTQEAQGGTQKAQKNP